MGQFINLNDPLVKKITPDEDSPRKFAEIGDDSFKVWDARN